jgi:hypothetical protein
MEEYLGERLPSGRFGDLPSTLTQRVRRLSEPRLRALFDEALEFASLADVKVWLNQNAPR